MIYFALWVGVKYAYTSIYRYGKQVSHGLSCECNNVVLADQMPSTLLKVKDFRRSKEDNSLEVCDWNEYAILIFMKQMWPQTSEFANFVETCGEKVFLEHWKDWKDFVPKKFFQSLMLLIVIYESFPTKSPGNGTFTVRKLIYLKNTKSLWNWRRPIF